jgi:hypothetical protein
MADRLRGHSETIAQRLERDLAAFQRPLPPAYDACEKVATRVSSLSLVRYRLNDYSVPTTYGHRDVLVRGHVHEVVISCGADVIARHPRSYERHDFIFDPLHYLALIEQKINALDQAAPLVGWRLPEEFMTLRRLLKARMGKQGKREFVQVLRLIEVFPLDDVTAAARDAIARGAIGFDAVKHLILCHIERRPPRLDMTVYPYLPPAHVTMTPARLPSRHTLRPRPLAADRTRTGSGCSVSPKGGRHDQYRKRAVRRHAGAALPSARVRRRRPKCRRRARDRLHPSPDLDRGVYQIVNATATAPTS